MFASVGAPQIAEAGQGAAYAVGRALGGTLILWTIAYFVTIRRASIGWEVGSFMILLLIGTLTTLYSMGQNNIAVRDDLRTLTLLQFKEDDVTLPPGSAARGPVSAMFVEYFNGMAADGRALEARLSALGIERLAMPTRCAATPRSCPIAARSPPARQRSRTASPAARHGSRSWGRR